MSFLFFHMYLGFGLQMRPERVVNCDFQWVGVLRAWAGERMGVVVAQCLVLALVLGEDRPL